MRARQADSDAPQWTGNKRRDGLSVVEGLDGNWVILTDGPATCETCPCCGKLLQSAVAARLVADMLYPLARTEAR